MKTKNIFYLLLFFNGLFFSQGCAPVFSEMQSARLVGKGNTEFTPSFSRITFSQDGETEGVQSHVGLQVALGVDEKVDVRLRYEYIWEGEDNISVIGLGPKVSLLENKIAFYLPVGRALGEATEDTWEIQPTMLFTLPAIEDVLDITLAPKYIFPFCKGCESLVAVNLGLSLGRDVSDCAFRPEFGLLFNPGEKGNLSHFSFGFSQRIGNYSKE